MDEILLTAEQINALADLLRWHTGPVVLRTEELGTRLLCLFDAGTPDEVRFWLSEDGIPEPVT